MRLRNIGAVWLKGMAWEKIKISFIKLRQVAQNANWILISLFKLSVWNHHQDRSAQKWRSILNLYHQLTFYQKSSPSALYLTQFKTLKTKMTVKVENTILSRVTMEIYKLNTVRESFSQIRSRSSNCKIWSKWSNLIWDSKLKIQIKQQKKLLTRFKWNKYRKWQRNPSSRVSKHHDKNKTPTLWTNMP